MTLLRNAAVAIGAAYTKIDSDSLAPFDDGLYHPGVAFARNTTGAISYATVGSAIASATFLGTAGTAMIPLVGPVLATVPFTLGSAAAAAAYGAAAKDAVDAVVHGAAAVLAPNGEARVKAPRARAGNGRM